MVPDLEITTVFEQNISSYEDPEVLEYAWHNRWLVVSHDVNTMKAHAEKRISDGDEIHGLFLAPQIRTTRVIANSLVLIWSASEFEEWQNRVVFLPI
jgi:hypothetical protein